MATILVIDDEEAIREVLRDILEAEGHTVFTAENGERGLAVQRAHRAELVITDIFMPQKEGIETIMELRHEFPRLKIIAISGGGTLRALDYLPTAEQFGAVRTLSKPFETAAVVATVRELLG